MLFFSCAPVTFLHEDILDIGPDYFDGGSGGSTTGWDVDGVPAILQGGTYQTDVESSTAAAFVVDDICGCIYCYIASPLHTQFRTCLATSTPDVALSPTAQFPSTTGVMMAYARCGR